MMTSGRPISFRRCRTVRAAVASSRSLACISRFTLCAIRFTSTPIRRTCAPVSLTPGDVTHPKLAQLDELHIHLVMPKVVKESYDDLIQGETMTFSRFIEEVQGLQAGRPQSLTLL